MNRAESQRELEALRRCVNRGQPLGSDAWVERMTKRFGLDAVFRPQGRPRKELARNGHLFPPTFSHLVYPRKAQSGEAEYGTTIAGLVVIYKCCPKADPQSFEYLRKVAGKGLPEGGLEKLKGLWGQTNPNWTR